MVNQQLLDYVKQQLQQGISGEEIKKTLISAGWPAADVVAIIPSAAPATPPAPATIVPPTQPLGSANYAPATNPVQLWTPNKTSGKGKKIALFAGLAAGILLLVGGGVWAYFNYFQSPEKILDKMMDNWSRITTVNADTEMVIENLQSSLPASPFLPSTPNNSSGDKNATGKITIKAKTIYDLTDLNNIQADVATNINMKNVAGLGGTMSVGVDFKKINKAFYVQLTEVPVLGLIDLSALQNQWVRIDIAELAQKYGAGEKTINDLEKNNLTPEEINKIREVIRTSGIFKFVAKLPAEEINNQSTYHYKLAVSTEGFKKFSYELFNLLSKKFSQGKEPLDTKKLDEYFSKAKDKYWPEIEIWIGKKDLLPYKLITSGQIFNIDTDKVEGKYTITNNINSFNQPVKIESPASSKNIEELLGGLFGFMGNVAGNALGDARVKSRDAKRIADIKQIQVALELYYGDKNSYPISATPINLGTGNFKALNDRGWSNETVGLSVGVPTNYMGIVPGDPGDKGWNYTYCSATLKEPTKCTNSGESYIINFQLEGNSGGLSAGQHTATPAGISGTMTTVPPELSPDTLPQTLNPETNSGSNSGFFPLVGAKQRDDRRISDIKQIQTALEMYFVEKGDAYPVAKNLILGEGMAKSLIDTGFSSSLKGKTIYMSMVPANPTPGGSSYIYNSSSDAANYTITFTLEQDTGSFKAGPHTADMNGIK